MSISADTGIAAAGYVVAMAAAFGMIRMPGFLCRVTFLGGVGAMMLGAVLVPAAALPAHP